MVSEFKEYHSAEYMISSQRVLEMRVTATKAIEQLAQKLNVDYELSDFLQDEPFLVGHTEGTTGSISVNLSTGVVYFRHPTANLKAIDRGLGENSNRYHKYDAANKTIFASFAAVQEFFEPLWGAKLTSLLSPRPQRGRPEAPRSR